jgi:hypothetical protein
LSGKISPRPAERHNQKGDIVPRNKVLSLVMLTVGFTAACGNPESSTAQQQRPPSPPRPVQEKAPTASEIDVAVRSTADEFTRRLARNSDGQLLAMWSKAGTLHARWNSKKCDYFEPEVIDLLISINRTVKESPTVAAERTCGADTRTFQLTGTRFQLYRTGKLNDSQILANIK